MSMDGKITCIVVEDFEPLRNVLCSLLDFEQDIEVVGRAANGTALAALLERTEPDVVLLDVEMDTRTEGIDACRELVRAHPSLPVVMLTCHDEEDMILRAFEAGAVDYVLKSSSSAQIVEAVRNAHRSATVLNAHVATVLRRHMKDFGSMKESLLYNMHVLTRLTPAEMDVLRLLMQGRKPRDIA